MLLTKVKAWLPTLISKKLGVFIVAFIEALKLPHNANTKAVAVAIVSAVYIAAQAYVDANK